MCGGGVRDLLEGGGSRGGGEGVQGGAPPPPRRDIPNPQGTEKLLDNSAHGNVMLLAVNKRNSSLCQFRVPTSHQYTTTTTKRDIHHLMPNDSDLFCQSELELEQLEPDDDDEPESLPEWETSDKLSHSVATGMLKKSVAHAFCASL